MSKALSQAATLKPEIRLAQALSEFCGSLAEPRAREFKSLQTTSPPTPSDVIKLTEEMNRHGARTHKAWWPYATRMASFLDKVQSMSRIGDFLLGSAQNMMASGIWAAVKITFGVAIGSLSFFKRVSELFLKDLVQVYPESKDLQHLMCEYLITLVAFCQKIVAVLDKPTMLQLASPFIGFFDKEAGKFEAELNQWATAIDRKATVLLSQRQLDAAESVTMISRTLAKWAPVEASKRQAKKQQDIVLRSNRVQDRLCSKKSERVAAWRRQRKKGTTAWLFQEPKYTDWKESPESSILWIQGKLGSGKTVLLANLVADLHTRSWARVAGTSESPVVAYHFCDTTRAESITSEHIIGSLLQQMLASLDPGCDLLLLMDDYLQNSQWTSSDILDDEVIGMLRQLFPKNKHVYFVLDALDACSEDAVAEIIHAVNAVAGPCKVHFCCSMRIDAPASRIMRSTFRDINHQVTMSSAAFDAEMKLFIDAEFERRRHIRDMDESLQAILRDVLVEASEGMYLWIALQIEALFPLHATSLLSSADIPHLLENLPKDLPEAFDRALESIKDTRYGSCIFQLVAAARRPLTLDELRIALHVTSGDTNWNSASIPSDGKAIIALCGGNLLEVDEEHDTVHFIHHSVFRHLTTTVAGSRDDIATVDSAQYYFRQSDADTYMGCLCVTYLNYNIFDTALTSSSKMVLDTDHLTKKVTHLTLTETNVTTRIISAIRCRRAFGQQDVRIGQLLQRYLEPQVDNAELLMFSSYAHQYWIEHTTRFWPNRCSDAYHLFTRLLKSNPDHVLVPWVQDSLGWATDNSHFGILLWSLGESSEYRDRHAAKALIRSLQRHAQKVSQYVEAGDRLMAKELLTFTDRHLIHGSSLTVVPEDTFAISQRLQELQQQLSGSPRHSEENIIVHRIGRPTVHVYPRSNGLNASIRRAQENQTYSPYNPGWK